MHYVYLIRSERYPKQQYVRLTRNVKQRLLDHNQGRSPHTAKLCPWILVAYFVITTATQCDIFISGHADQIRDFGSRQLRLPRGQEPH